MYTVRVTHYDSPRSDCSGFFFTDFNFDTPKQAYRFAFHKNRQDSPSIAHCDLRSGRPRRYKLFVNNWKMLETTDITEFDDGLLKLRSLKLKDGNTRRSIEYSFEIL